MERASRYSEKRQAILEAICNTKTHPSADWVYRALKPAHPELSLGTVYRNLVFLRRRGLIRSVGVVNGQERFDSDTSLHSHFICRVCGGVTDLRGVDLPGGLDRRVGREYGLEVERHELVFHGICKNCAETAE